MPWFPEFTSAVELAQGKLAPPVRLIGRVVLHRARHTNDWHAGKGEVVSDT
jgi:hypothetical protein